ncbi:hypothetical protein E2542_SST05596 [Spatholobus suberectus]|nr:hypothetical protein E2542_SST05596 [Spatholobus suberectus]
MQFSSATWKTITSEVQFPVTKCHESSYEKRGMRGCLYFEAGKVICVYVQGLVRKESLALFPRSCLCFAFEEFSANLASFGVWLMGGVHCSINGYIDVTGLCSLWISNTRLFLYYLLSSSIMKMEEEVGFLFCFQAGRLKAEGGTCG